MTSRTIRTAIAAAATIGLLAASQTNAFAAKASNVGKLPGKAYVVKVTPDGKWLAAWSELGKNKFTLYVVNLEKGDRKEVVTVDDPGGLCWLPAKGELLYCKGTFKSGAKLPYTAVTYYVYRTGSGDTKKVGEVNDLLKDYQADPISAEDSSLAFHLTLSTTRTPSFNIYFPAEGRIKSLEAGATISADYDLSSDGSRLAWFLHGKDAKMFDIAIWDLEKANYESLFEWVGVTDPADNHMMLRLDMPHAQAAVLTVSNTDKQLNACIYRFVDPKSLKVIPVRLAAGDEAFELDWKGRSGLLALLVRNQSTKKFSIQEFNPSTGVAEHILETQDEVNHFEYAPTAQAYFYSVISPGAKPESVLVKVK